MNFNGILVLFLIVLINFFTKNMINIIQNYAYLNLLFSFCRLCFYVLHVQQWCTLMFKHILCVWICLKIENSSQVYLMRWHIGKICVGIITYLMCGIWVIFFFYLFIIFRHLSRKCIIFSFCCFLAFSDTFNDILPLRFSTFIASLPQSVQKWSSLTVCENNCCLYSALQQQISDVCGAVNCLYELLCLRVAVQVGNSVIPHIIYKYCTCQQNVSQKYLMRRNCTTSLVSSLIQLISGLPSESPYSWLHALSKTLS